MSKYNHQKIERKWQKYWEENKLYEVKEDSEKKKFYVLDMFPYPSSQGLHVGHPEGYTATDIIARYKIMKGLNVLHPMGWDAFGLPAENYAIKIGGHPAKITYQNIKNFKRQIKSLGFAYDWSREITTCDPSYYKWTQWIFLTLYKSGLAYKKMAPVNFCPSCKTVLAREQVIDGKCERCKSLVKQKFMSQWFFKITAYADKLLKGLEKIDWPEPIKLMQKNWIGKSEGAIVKFQISNSKFQIDIFTTRIDTIFGCTYLVVAPEHKIISNLKSKISNLKEVEEYIEKTKYKSELQRTDLNREKTGVKLEGVYAINPFTQEKIPIFVADYVIGWYGTGAIMAVPAHDQRDLEFARKYNLPIKVVVSQDGKEFEIKDKAFEEEGVLINSGSFSGLSSKEAKEEMVKFAEEKGFGRKAVQYKLRDWLISRQRYWGAPIPIVYCKKCYEKKIEDKIEMREGIDYTQISQEKFAIIPVPEKDLPVKLPDLEDFKPTGDGRSPLARSKEFVNTTCPVCGSFAIRETDTMDTFVCSSWYYLRYCDPKNEEKAFSKEKIKYWMPVDLYIGGAEHAVLHLLYSRFITKVLYDLEYVNFDEPFLKLRNQGLILGEDGYKMSKSRGNVINPDEIVEKYGADTMRLYEMFMGPLEDSKPWSTQGIMGVRRFLEKVYKEYHRFIKDYERLGDEEIDEKIEKLLHKTIKKVSLDIENLRFNTAISQMMIFINSILKIEKKSKKYLEIYKTFLKLLAPFAPHIAEELWFQLLEISKKPFETIFKEEWPLWKEDKIEEEELELPIQINGKTRAVIKINKSLSKEEIFAKIYKNEKIKKRLTGKKIIKEIYVPGRIVNLLIK